MDESEKKVNEESIYLVELDDKNTIEFNVGWLAKQAGGSVLLKSQETAILATATMAKEPREGLNFLPLTVEYQEKFYAAGRIPGGFIKREGKPREKEVLTSRLIDRPLRPLFPKKLRNELQVIIQVMSMDPEVTPDVHAITAASTAVTLSDMPFSGPVAGVRVGRIKGEFVLNPAVSQLEESDIDLTIAGTENAILMIEGASKFVSEEEMLSAVEFAKDPIQKLCRKQVEIAQELGKAKYEVEEDSEEPEFLGEIRTKYEDQLKEACFLSDKHTRAEAIDQIINKAVEELPEEDEEKRKQTKNFLYGLEREIVREAILAHGKRVDGRSVEEVRDIDIRLGLLPRAHGSALFTRGETQSLGVITLGTAGDVQRTDDLEGESSRRFMLHYNFPPFCVGEVGRMLGPGRREIGHGKLAEKALEPIIPDNRDFPYTIRLVSDILESNGSSSMASVCSGSLAMSQAGVPIKDMVAGVAMGLILTEDGRYSVLTDISGTEDHLGDMDFKVAGTKEGITSFQMDIKVEGITTDIMRKALSQAKDGRLFILEKMTYAIPQPADDLSDYAPRITTLQINQEKIGELIGPGGRNVRTISESCDAEINIEDSGVVTIAATNAASSAQAIDMIRSSIADVEVGKIYEGKVKRVMEYGAFVEIVPGKEGLCHISKLDRTRVRNVTDVVKEGETIQVKVLGVDRSGKIDLSRKDALPWQ